MTDWNAVAEEHGLEPLTWRWVATQFPEFVQWVVQRHGPLPDGKVVPEDYDRYAAEYRSESGL